MDYLRFDEDDLKNLPLFQWGPLLFCSLDMEANPKKYFQAMQDRLSWLPLDEFIFRPELSAEYTVKAHWALYCENYLEGFHIPFVHAGLNAVIDFGNYTTEIFDHSNLQLGLAKTDEEIFELPASSPDHGKKVAAYSISNTIPIASKILTISAALIVAGCPISRF